MLIKHNEKTADMSHAPKPNSGKPSPKGLEAGADKGGHPREKELAELRRFVQDQVERYNADRARLERELAESKRNVRSLMTQIDQFKQLLLESPLGIRQLPLASDTEREEDPVVLDPPPVKGLPSRRPTPSSERRGVAHPPTAKREEEHEEMVEVIPPAPHLLTTEALFVRSVDVDEVPESANYLTLSLGILACMIIAATFLFLYWEPFADQLSNAILSLIGEKPPQATTAADF